MQDHKTPIFSLIALCALLWMAAPAHADTLQVSLGGSESTISDKSFDYLSDDIFYSLGQINAEYAILDNLWVGLEYQWGAENPYAEGSVTSTLGTDGLFLNARYGYAPTNFLSVYGGAGAGFYHLGMETQFNGLEKREQDLYIGAFHGVVGVELSIPPRGLRRFFGISRRSWASNVRVGLLFEGGYRYATEANFDNLQIPDPDKEPEPEDRLIDTQSISLGTVDLSGPIARSALFVRF